MDFNFDFSKLLELSENKKISKIKFYTEIDSIKDVNTIDIRNDTHKVGVGFLTDSYDPLSNSAGQDNIGQILSAICRYKILKEELGENYHGGLLLIDEIERGSNKIHGMVNELYGNLVSNMSSMHDISSYHAMQDRKSMWKLQK